MSAKSMRGNSVCWRTDGSDGRVQSYGTLQEKAMSDHKIRSAWPALATPQGRMILVGRAAAQRAAERASAEAAASQAARVAV